MDAGRWKRIEHLYHKALGLSPEARAGFLGHACADDPELREEVVSLVEAAGQAGGFLATPLPGAALQSGLLQSVDEAADALVGRRLGPYRLHKVIGAGGMGTVYLAARDDEQYRKHVAVKIVRPGIHAEAVLRRFRIERQALANLEHSNIARLLDAGTTDGGLPYLVMEYVEGRPIDEYCDVHRLSIRRRLDLFLAVCAAVQHAHRNLTVHRDLKPGNILVTAGGEPKLVDFGIAKILDTDLSQTAASTQTHRFLTPECASPEQILGRPITTATDVYSLGVVLYELLTGHWPYGSTTGSPLELGRRICEQEPIPPSVAVRRLAESRSADAVTWITPQAVSLAREGTPERLRRRLSGDLDNIVMMALRKEPERRYAGVEQLADEIRRHLGGRPVLARRPTLRYRAARYLTRNKAPALAAALALLSLTGAILGVMRESRRARAEAMIAGRVLASMSGLFGDFDPMAAGGQPATIRSVLDRGGERVFRDLEDLPEAQVMLAERIAASYAGLGLWEEQIRWRERAVEIQRLLYREDDARLAEGFYLLGGTLVNHDPPRAEGFLHQALAMQRRLLSEDDPEVARTIHALAMSRFRQHDLPEAEGLLRQALGMSRRFPGPPFDLVLRLRDLAHLLHVRRRYDEAEKLLREALGVVVLLQKDRPESMIAVKKNLAGLLHDRGRYEEAEPHYREVLGFWKEQVGEEHPSVASAKSDLALLLKDRGAYAEAEKLCREAIGFFEGYFGRPDHAMAESRHSLAKILSDKGDVAGAEKEARKAVNLHAEVWGRGHIHTEAATRLLARILVELDRCEEAEPLARESLRIHEEVIPESWETAMTASILGAALAGQGRFHEAERLLLDSYPRIRDDRGPQHKRTRQAVERIITLYDAWHRPADAARYRAILARTAGAVMPGHHPMVGAGPHSAAILLDPREASGIPRGGNARLGQEPR